MGKKIEILSHVLRVLPKYWTHEKQSGLIIFKIGKSKDASRLLKHVSTEHLCHHFIAKL